jgi:glycosyltransferase involved in cell wall biosynthesis
MSIRRKKVLILVDWYLPGYKAGGPIQSVANIVSELGHLIDFSIITFNTDLGESSPYPGIEFNKWTKAPDSTRIFYFSKEAFSFQSLKVLLRSETYDTLYLNSVFSTKLTLMPLFILKSLKLRTKIVLAPRGMLGPEALEIKSTKKRIFLPLARLINLYGNVIWHASTTIEVDEIKRVFGNSAKIQIALNLSARNRLALTAKDKKTKEARFVYMARVSPKKNLPAVLKAMNQLPNDLKVVFDIYGSNEDPDYWQECEALIKAAPAHVHISYKGGIQHSEVTETLSHYDFGVLYTKNENFGHTIVEYLSVGLPVVISDKTPWNGLEEKCIGWNATLANEKTLLAALIAACQMDQKTYDTWSRAAFEFASGITNNNKAIEDNVALFA